MRRSTLAWVALALALCLAAPGGWAAPYDALVLGDSPYAYWRLGELAGTTAVNAAPSGPALDGDYGRFVPGDRLPVLGAPGVPGSGMGGDTSVDFVPNSQVYVADPVHPTAYSLEAWVRPDPGATAGRGIIVRTAGNPYTTWSHELRVDPNGKFEHYTFDGAARYVWSADAAQPGQWYHVVGTAANGGGMTLYVDGQEAASWAGPVGTLWTGGNQWRLGAPSGNGTIHPGGIGFWDGQIDEVALYHHELTPQQVANHYNLGVSESPNAVDMSGTVYYAVGLGDTADRVVKGKWFEGDNDGDPAPVGYSVVAPNAWASGWGTLGVTEPNLAPITDSMRYNLSSPVDITLRHLPPGEEVQVQLFLSEGFHDSSRRIADVIVQGEKKYASVDPWTLWGYKTPGLLATTGIVAADGTLNVQIAPTPGAPDPNPALSAIVVSSPGARRVLSAADLDLARVRYAVNVGGNDDQVVGGVTFEADADGDPDPAGYSVTSQHVAMNWATPAVVDPALAEVYDDIRWTGGGAVTQQFAGLTPDRPVKVQMMLCESHHSQPGSRPIDVTIEGQKRWDDLDPLALWGRHGAGVATAYARVGSDGVLDIVYTADSGPDQNPIINGIIVSDVPGRKINPVAVTASGEYQPLPRFPATAVLDGSWADQHPAHHGGATADYWLLPDNTTGYLQFDLGEQWNLEFIEIHNTDNSQWGDRGTIAYHIDISPTDTFELFETIAAGTLPTWDEGWLSRPVSSDNYWQYARFYVDDFGGTNGAAGGGLAEIAFYGQTPEPATMALVALGLLALVRRRRA